MSKEYTPNLIESDEVWLPLVPATVDSATGICQGCGVEPLDLCPPCRELYERTQHQVPIEGKSDPNETP